MLGAVRFAAIGVLLFTGIAMAQDDAPAADKRQAVLQKVCSTCHAMDEVSARRSRSQWEDLLYKMIDLGAKGTVLTVAPPAQATVHPGRDRALDPVERQAVAIDQSRREG